MFLRICGSVLALIIGASAIWAGADDYRFEIVSTDHRVGSGVTIELRLTDLRTGQPVEGAVIYATRMDMAPDGMEMMTSPVTALPAEGPGTYLFSTDLTMAGGWRFSVAAKVQGEPETSRPKSNCRPRHERGCS
jgi:hypothetical protein